MTTSQGLEPPPTSLIIQHPSAWHECILTHLCFRGKVAAVGDNAAGDAVDDEAGDVVGTDGVDNAGVAVGNAGDVATAKVVVINIAAEVDMLVLVLMLFRGNQVPSLCLTAEH